MRGRESDGWASGVLGKEATGKIDSRASLCPGEGVPSSPTFHIEQVLAGPGEGRHLGAWLLELVVARSCANRTWAQRGHKGKGQAAGDLPLPGGRSCCRLGCSSSKPDL